MSTWYVVVDDGAAVRVSRNPFPDGIPLQARAYAVEARDREEAKRLAKARYARNEPSDDNAFC